MIKIRNKQELIESLIEARKGSYENFYEQIEIAKSVYGKAFIDRLWEYLGINIEYMGTKNAVDSLNEKIEKQMFKTLNESENKKQDEDI